MTDGHHWKNMFWLKTVLCAIMPKIPEQDLNCPSQFDDKFWGLFILKNKEWNMKPHWTLWVN